MTETTKTLDNPQSGTRKKLLSIFALLVVLAAIGWGAWYFVTQLGRVHTDNAYVGADTAQVTALISGPVKEVRAKSTQMVMKGDILVILDDSDARVELAAAEAMMLQARQRFMQAQATGRSLSARVSARSADTGQAQAKLAAAEADFARAKAGYARRQALSGSGAVSGEELSVARADMAASEANLAQARAAIASATATTASAGGDVEVNRAVTAGMTLNNNPDVAAARARLEAARLMVDRTIIRAPISGVVAQKNVQVGQRINAGAPIMLLVPVDNAFVDANFKETELRHVQNGQTVDLTSDYYGSDIVFKGKVIGFAGGTGAAFALIPAQNASGNWVKVVQRLPVRIALDPADLKAHPLRVGLSMSATVDTRTK